MEIRFRRDTYILAVLSTVFGNKPNAYGVPLDFDLVLVKIEGQLPDLDSFLLLLDPHNPPI